MLQEVLSKSPDLNALLELRGEESRHLETVKTFEAKLENLQAVKSSSEKEMNELAEKICGLQTDKEALEETVAALEERAARVEELTQKLYYLEAEKADIIVPTRDSVFALKLLHL